MIATPIGNKQDVTLRAIEHMRTLPVFFAEDTRELEKLWGLVGVESGGKRLYSYAKHNLKSAGQKALTLLSEGLEIGLVTDRGTPGISDPGAELVRMAREAGHEIRILPGPSSLTAAYSVSGLGSSEFLFLGFLPDSPKARKWNWERVLFNKIPAVFLESPQRIRATAQELKEVFPKGRLFVAREMTKLFESYAWHELNSLQDQSLVELGEYVVILEPGPSATSGTSSIADEIQLRLASDRDWSKRVGDRLGMPHSELYNALQKVKREREESN